MFRIDCLVEDRNIAKALSALGPFTQNLKVSRTVTARDVAKPKINGKRPTYDSSKDMIADALRKLDGPIKAPQMKDVLKAMGYSPTSYSYFLAEMVKKKLLKRTGKGSASTYELVP